jgi:hypothetical protein
MRKLDALLDAIDHAYERSISDPEWLRVLLEVLAPELGCIAR